MANIVDGAVLDRELNPEQAAAAKKIDGPMLILAGAGSGKTRAITYKIAHLVSQYNVEPDRILAVTFTNKAAREMKDRIQKLLGCNMNFFWMGTFHSVCLKILKKCLVRQDVQAAMGTKWFDGNFSIYDDDDQRRVLKGILKEKIGDNIEPGDIKKVHAAISKFKNTVLYKGGKAQLQTPEIALQNAEGPDEEDCARYYAEYQKQLKESNAMDFDDLLFNMVYLLQTMPNLASQLAYRFRYVVVDEYQDTNDVQYELLKFLINKETNNVTVVGDDDQSIYGWRGANIQIIRNFHRDFAPVTIVKLERNYRSTANIVKGAGTVIAHNVRPQEMQKVVYSREESGELIHVRYLMSDPVVLNSNRTPRALDKKEAYAIAETIVKAGKDNYAKTAIFYRTNAQSRVIEEALNRYRIPLVIFGGTKFWDRKEVKDILAYMRLLINERDDAAFLRVINTPSRSIGKKTVDDILNRKKISGESFWKCLLAEVDSQNRSSAKLKVFVDKVISWRKILSDKENSIRQLVEKIINDIDYNGFLEKEDEITAAERKDNVSELLNAIADFESKNVDASLETFLQEVSLLTDADKNVDVSTGFVTLMTIHMAKGLEFHTVHIAGCCEGIFPLIRNAQHPEANKLIEEERRLFYVGCTRAEKILYLYYTQCRFLQGQRQIYLVSSFLEELEEEPSVMEKEIFYDNEGLPGAVIGYGNNEFNQDVSSYSSSSISNHSTNQIRYNSAPVGMSRRPSSSSFGNYGRSSSGSGGYNRSASVSSSIRKNDRHIIYKNPIKVNSPVKQSVSSGPRIVYDEYSENPFHPGARVRHIKFGVGVVISCSGSGKDAHVQVRFSRDGEIRTILAQFLQVGG